MHELDAKERAGGIHGRNLHGPAWLFMTTLSRVWQWSCGCAYSLFLLPGLVVEESSRRAGAWHRARPETHSSLAPVAHDGTDASLPSRPPPQVLAPHVTLELCFLAAWTARAAVSPHDITRSAASGRLPFLTLAADSEEFMAPYRALISRLYLARAGGRP